MQLREFWKSESAEILVESWIVELDLVVLTNGSAPCEGLGSLKPRGIRCINVMRPWLKLHGGNLLENDKWLGRPWMNLSRETKKREAAFNRTLSSHGKWKYISPAGSTRNMYCIPTFSFSTHFLPSPKCLVKKTPKTHTNYLWKWRKWKRKSNLSNSLSNATGKLV